jgi:hypothetical protein
VLKGGIRRYQSIRWRTYPDAKVVVAAGAECVDCLAIGIGFPPVGFLTALMFLVASGRRLLAKKASVMKCCTFIDDRTANSLTKYCGRG